MSGLCVLRFLTRLSARLTVLCRAMLLPHQDHQIELKG